MRARTSIPSLEYERAFWRDGFECVAGLDEAGRGALAGPVVAAAVILPRIADDASGDWTRHGLFRKIARADDSKKLNESLREKLFEPICALASAFAIGAASHLEIDEINILRASYLAMDRALAALSLAPDALLLDALVLHNNPLPQQGISYGDSLVLSIAAASILAKVSRDRIMRELDLLYPMYGFVRNKGYGTEEHLRALSQYGPCPVHRKSYEPVAQAALDL